MQKNEIQKALIDSGVDYLGQGEYRHWLRAARGKTGVNKRFFLDRAEEIRRKMIADGLKDPATLTGLKRRAL